MLTLKEILDDFRAYAGHATDVDVSVGSRSSGGESPMHWMATLGDPAAIALLLEAGADVDVQDHFGDTPLHAACVSRQWAAVEVLAVAGANRQLRNAAGKTALDLAVDAGHAPAVARLRGESWPRAAKEAVSK